MEFPCFPISQVFHPVESTVIGKKENKFLNSITKKKTHIPEKEPNLENYLQLSSLWTNNFFFDQ